MRAVVGIVSGGPTGAEQAGLRAARKLGLKTGGFAPLGFKTEAGPQPWLGPTYNLAEADSEDYSVRTELNVMFSDATVIFGKESAGSSLTERMCREQGKPCMWIHEFARVYDQATVAPKFRLWCERNHVTVLNVAGNREKKHPGIGIAVERFLVSVLPTIK